MFEQYKEVPQEGSYHQLPLNVALVEIATFKKERTDCLARSGLLRRQSPDYFLGG